MPAKPVAWGGISGCGLPAIGLEQFGNQHAADFHAGGLTGFDLHMGQIQIAESRPAEIGVGEGGQGQVHVIETRESAGPQNLDPAYLRRGRPLRFRSALVDDFTHAVGDKCKY